MSWSQERVVGQWEQIGQDRNESLCLRKARELQAINESGLSQWGREGLMIRGYISQSNGRHWKGLSE